MQNCSIPFMLYSDKDSWHLIRISQIDLLSYNLHLATHIHIKNFGIGHESKNHDIISWLIIMYSINFSQ